MRNSNLHRGRSQNSHIIGRKAGTTGILLLLLILLGITALWRALRDGEAATLRGDRRFWWLGVAAVPAYLAAMSANCRLKPATRPSKRSSRNSRRAKM